MDLKRIRKLSGCGGCTAKLPAGALKDALTVIPHFSDDNLLVGFDSSDDGAVYRLTNDLAVIQTLDFFPPVTDDPYLYGKIAAANALSDIYAMGGTVRLALNIVCFPEREDPALLCEILRGGAEKVAEAGGLLCGGHSIHDEGIKYGLSVTGIVHPDHIYRNDRCQPGDAIILTKPLGTGIIMAAYTAFGNRDAVFDAAVKSMQTLNKYAAEIIQPQAVSACTDVTGFGFLGHLYEMVQPSCTIIVNTQTIPILPGAYDYATEFILTAGGQRNRKHFSPYITAHAIDEALMEIMYDPQTSGGLLVALPEGKAEALTTELCNAGIPAAIVARVVERGVTDIILK